MHRTLKSTFVFNIPGWERQNLQIYTYFMHSNSNKTFSWRSCIWFLRGNFFNSSNQYGHPVYYIYYIHAIIETTNIRYTVDRPNREKRTEPVKIISIRICAHENWRNWQALHFPYKQSPEIILSCAFFWRLFVWYRKSTNIEQTVYFTKCTGHLKMHTSRIFFTLRT